VTRWLLRFGYDGSAYRGWARQPGQPTVEGTLLDRLRRSSLGRTLGSFRLDVASRTDAGVSARANALALTSSLSAGALLRGLNGLAPSIFFTAARPIHPEFRVRAPRWREYRYFLAGDRARSERLQTFAETFPTTLDVRSFARGAPPDRPTFRKIEPLAVRSMGSTIRIDVRGPSFQWGMVRKIVGALVLEERGELTTADLAAGAAGTKRLTLPLAPPDGLVLWEVHYPGRWSVVSATPSREQAAHFQELERALAVRRPVLRALRRVQAGRRRVR